MSEPPGWLAPPPPTPPPPPAGAPPASAPEVEGAPQLWGQPPPGRLTDYRWIKVAGAVAVIVVVVWALSTLLMPGFRTPPSFPTPTPTPAGVEYARASAFWNNAGLPALAGVIRSKTGIAANCKGKLSTSCRDAITNADQKVQYAITVINQGDIPACLTTHVTRFKSDLLSMDGGLQIALKGYKDGDQQEVNQGLSQFQVSSQPLTEDAAAVTNDVKILCN
jgi:hypothetical protein